ncbi:hypothetical protein MTO96_014572 [Rhipicephalus appendiculatus]
MEEEKGDGCITGYNCVPSRFRIRPKSSSCRALEGKEVLYGEVGDALFSGVLRAVFRFERSAVVVQAEATIWKSCGGLTLSALKAAAEPRLPRCGFPRRAGRVAFQEEETSFPREGAEVHHSHTLEGSEREAGCLRIGGTTVLRG